MRPVNSPLCHHRFLACRTDSRIASGHDLVKRMVVWTICVRSEGDLSFGINALKDAGGL
jgi:hypothetical protein